LAKPLLLISRGSHPGRAVTRFERHDLAAAAGAALLLAGSVAIVAWQDTRVGALQDLSYVLNNAYRIAAGDVPYRDFTQPHPPLTFLVQAAIVRAFDSSYWHHEAYAALLSGLATLVAWAVCVRLLAGALPRPRLFAFVICLPLIPLGIHSLVPHPWYDADASFLSLLAVYALVGSAGPDASPVWPALAGALTVLPAFAKQNIGLAAFAGLQVAALPLAFRRETRRRHVLFLAGTIACAAVSLALIAHACGLHDYFYWTVAFAAERRLAPGLLLVGWDDVRLWTWLGIAALGVEILALGRRAAVYVGSGLLLLPLAWGLLADDGTRVFFRLWPFTLSLATALAVRRIARGGRAFEAMLVLALVGLCLAAFLAHGVEGSNFALWPFFSILTAASAAFLASLSGAWGAQVGETYLALAAATALATGIPRLLENRRLNFIHDAGPVATSRHPRLAGLHVKGSYLPRLDELLAFLEANVPRGEGIAQIHGEDPLYFALRRPPPLPIAIFDRTVNPYTPVQLVSLFLDRDVRWVVVKKRRQIRHQPMAGFERVVRLLRLGYAPVLENETYLVLHRSAVPRDSLQAALAAHGVPRHR
jgi:hypothetical protein